MGWDYTHRPKGISNLDWFRKQLCPSNPDRLIDTASHGKTVYAAWKRDDGKIIALVILTNQAKDPYFNFGWKDMSESMGPCEDHCPEKILKLLSPVNELYPDGDMRQWAQDWRDRCWAHATDKNRCKLATGSVVTFKDPVQFTNGAELKAVVITNLKPLRFHPIGGWGTYRMSKNALMDRFETVYPDLATFAQANPEYQKAINF